MKKVIFINRKTHVFELTHNKKVVSYITNVTRSDLYTLELMITLIKGLRKGQ